MINEEYVNIILNNRFMKQNYMYKILFIRCSIKILI